MTNQLYTLEGQRVEAFPPAVALYPFGVFTSFVAVDGAVLGWQRHVDRLAVGTAELWDHQLDRDQLADVTRSHLGQQGRSSASVRISIYPRTFSLASPDQADGCMILISSSSTSLPFRVSSTFAVTAVQYTRTLPHLKSTGLFTLIHLRRAARLAGFDDALLASGERVLEGTTWSVVVWRQGRVITPNADVLPSVTVEKLGVVARDLGWTFEYGDVQMSDLLAADLVLAVNVNSPVRAISRIDGDDIRVDSRLLADIAAVYNELAPEVV